MSQTRCAIISWAQAESDYANAVEKARKDQIIQAADQQHTEIMQ